MNAFKRRISDLDQYCLNGAPKITKVSDNYGQLDVIYYERWLQFLTNPTAVYLKDKILNLTALNSFGIPQSKINPNSFLAWTLKEKCKYPKCILVIQVGDFFELYGIDAIMAVEFGGLRAMGKLPTMKAGTPLLSLQRLLDSFIRNDFIVRVYEECVSSNTGLYKKRKMCQVVSKSNPVYFRALNSVEEDDIRECLPIVYVLIDTILSVDIISRTFTIYHGLSKPSMIALISSIRPAEIYCLSAFRINVPSYLHPQIISSVESVESILSKLHQNYEMDTNEQFVESKPIDDRIPLMKSTTDQLGIASNIDSIPDLVSSALGKPSLIERRFFTDWVLVKPTMNGRMAMKSICDDISNGNILINNIRPLNPNKIYGLLASGGVCKDRSLLNKLNYRILEKVECENLHVIASEYLSISQNYSVYQNEMEEISTLMTAHLSIHEGISSIIPTGFVSRNEIYMVNVASMENMLKSRTKLERLLEQLKYETVYLQVENELAICQAMKPNTGDIIQSSNRRGPIKNRWTTADLSNLVEKYIRSCEECLKDQLDLVRTISFTLTSKYGNSLRLFLQCEVIAKCIHTHLANVIPRGWNSAQVDQSVSEIVVQDGFPHWLSNSNATLNSLTMVEGEMVLLTAPNATGKTTLIRSLMVSAILAHAGLYVPAKYAKFPEMNHFFLRLPGSDRPAERLSSFESEIQDLHLMLDMVDHRSLICLDELARSTCPKEGIAIARAVMEFLLRKKCFCIFSTHLHELLDQTIAITCMTMGENHEYTPGQSRTSKALEICKKHHVNPEIIQRAADILGIGVNPKIEKTTKQRLEEIGTKITMGPVRYINVGMLIPPYLTSSPCVYIIEEKDNLWYCGESKHIIQRQHQHRIRNNRYGNILIFPVDNKTIALECETKIQLKCIEMGINLSSFNDSYHTL
jgi:energy-coupling factor transporter ATP-binding protein EcfA2